MQRTGSRSSLPGGWGLGEERLSRSTSRLSLSRSGSFGGGYFHRSASSGSVFGRTLRSASAYTPPFQSTALQRATPHYMDRYPYVRYSYGGNEAGLNLLAAGGYARSSDSGRMGRYYGSAYGAYTPPSRYSSYNSPLSRPYAPSATSSSYRAYTPLSRYASYTSLLPSTYYYYTPSSYSYGRGSNAPIDKAMDWYKGRVMTVGTLSKYWLSSGSNTYSSRRQRDASLNYVSPRDPYASRFSSTPRIYSSYY